MIVAIAPDRAFTPRVAAISPVGPAGGAASGFPVFIGEVSLGRCNCGLGSIAPFEAIGSGFPRGIVGEWAVADFRKGRGVACTIDKIFGANDRSSGFTCS